MLFQRSICCGPDNAHLLHVPKHGSREPSSVCCEENGALPNKSVINIAGELQNPILNCSCLVGEITGRWDQLSDNGPVWVPDGILRVQQESNQVGEGRGSRGPEPLLPEGLKSIWLTILIFTESGSPSLWWCIFHHRRWTGYSTCVVNLGSS